MENEDNDEKMITSEDNITDSISITNNNINNTYLSQKSPSIIYSVFSIISWILFIITGLFGIFFSLLYNNNDYVFIWSIKRISSSEKKKYFPIQINWFVIYLLFIITLVFGAIQSFYYIISSMKKKNIIIYFSMMGEISKFHFVPLFCVSGLFIIGISSNYVCDKDKTHNPDLHFINGIISGIVLSLFGLISLLIIYVKTEVKSDSFIKVLLIKKGVYSCLISLMVYTFFNNILYSWYIIRKYVDKDNFSNNWLNYYGIIFSGIIGILNLILSFFLKDIALAGMNTLIYFGMTLYFYSIDEVKSNFTQYIDGIIDIAMILLSISIFGYLITDIKNNNK
jgi:hypothetical protein